MDGAFRELRSAHAEMATIMAQRVEAQADAVGRLSSAITASLAERPTTPQVKQLIRETRPRARIQVPTAQLRQAHSTWLAAWSGPLLVW